MRTLQIKIPDSVERNDAELTMLIAAKLYEEGTLSSGQAAELAGVSKRTFIEILGKYGVSLINHPPSEIAKDADRL